jgi:uroporphyrinogen-III decarboxylase
MGLPHGFMFLRLMDLRGFEEIMVDFAEEPPELQRLIDIVRDYNIRQTELMIAKDPDREIYYFGDDNGMQHSLPISPDTWRKYMKPAYRAIYDVVHRAGKLVYMHTDGCIWPVIADMQEAGVNVLNPQIRANGLAHLVDTCKGKICIELDLDRQLFPFAAPAEIEKHIEECTRAMYLPEGGLMLCAECAADVPLDNIEAICCTLERMRDFKG